MIIALILVAIFSSVTAPLYLAHRTEKMHREDLRIQYAREDEVARLAAGSILSQNAQLERIHTLVNSDMTAARQSERDQTMAMTAVLRRVISLAQSRGQAPDVQDVEALQAAEKRVFDLDRILADRLAQMRLVNAEAAKAGTS